MSVKLSTKIEVQFPTNVLNTVSERLSNNPLLFEAIHRRLADLRPVSISISDESHLHEGHKEAGNGCHLALEVVSDSFDGLSGLERHRAIYSSLDSLQELGIHALSIRAITPQEKNSNENAH